MLQIIQVKDLPKKVLVVTNFIITFKGCFRQGLTADANKELPEDEMRWKPNI